MKLYAFKNRNLNELEKTVFRIIILIFMCCLYASIFALFFAGQSYNPLDNLDSMASYILTTGSVEKQEYIRYIFKDTYIYLAYVILSIPLMKINLLYASHCAERGEMGDLHYTCKAIVSFAVFVFLVYSVLLAISIRLNDSPNKPAIVHSSGLAISKETKEIDNLGGGDFKECKLYIVK